MKRAAVMVRRDPKDPILQDTFPQNLGDATCNLCKPPNSEEKRLCSPTMEGIARCAERVDTTEPLKFFVLIKSQMT